MSEERGGDSFDMDTDIITSRESLLSRVNDEARIYVEEKSDDPMERLEEEMICFLCKSPIIASTSSSSSLNGDIFRPCDESCSSIVHVRCVVNDERWLSRRCLKCGKIFKNPTAPAKPQRLNTDRRRCFICDNTRFDDKSSPRVNSSFLRPCFCELDCHHGCIAETVLVKKNCKACGVEYNYFVYGSLKDFFVRYAYQYLICLFLFLFMLSLAGYSLYKAISASDNYSFARIFLFVIGITLIGIGIVCSVFCLKHTLRNRIPRFRARYGQITVMDYDPTPIRPRHKVSWLSTRWMKDDDMNESNISIDQHMFGMNNHNWQASTPLASHGQQVKFTFDTPKQDREYIA